MGGARPEKGWEPLSEAEGWTVPNRNVSNGGFTAGPPPSCTRSGVQVHSRTCGLFVAMRGTEEPGNAVMGFRMRPEEPLLRLHPRKREEKGMFFLRDTAEKRPTHCATSHGQNPGRRLSRLAQGWALLPPSRVAVCPDKQRVHVNKEKGEVNLRRQVAGFVTPPDPLR